MKAGLHSWQENFTEEERQDLLERYESFLFHMSQDFYDEFGIPSPLMDTLDPNYESIEAYFGTFPEDIFRKEEGIV